MTKEQKALLAKYLTGSSRVVNHSMGLQLGGARAEEAKEFFALRDAFGVRGYATTAEALKALKG